MPTYLPASTTYTEVADKKTLEWKHASPTAMTFAGSFVSAMHREKHALRQQQLFKPCTGDDHDTGPMLAPSRFQPS